MGETCRSECLKPQPDFTHVPYDTIVSSSFEILLRTGDLVSMLNRSAVKFTRSSITIVCIRSWIGIFDHSWSPPPLCLASVDNICFACCTTLKDTALEAGSLKVYRKRLDLARPGLHIKKQNSGITADSNSMSHKCEDLACHGYSTSARSVMCVIELLSVHNEYKLSNVYTPTPPSSQECFP